MNGARCNSVDVHEYIIFLFSLIDGITCEGKLVQFILLEETFVIHYLTVVNKPLYSTSVDPGGDSSAAEVRTVVGECVRVPCSRTRICVWYWQLRWKSDGQISYRGFEASQERRRHSRIFLGGAMYNATHGTVSCDCIVNQHLLVS